MSDFRVTATDGREYRVPEDEEVTSELLASPTSALGRPTVRALRLDLKPARRGDEVYLRRDAIVSARRWDRDE